MLILDTIFGNRELQDIVKDIEKMLRDIIFSLPIEQVAKEFGESVERLKEYLNNQEK